MSNIDGDTMLAIAQHYHGDRAATQTRVVSVIGPILQETLVKYDILPILRTAHFLAQMCHESEDFTAVEEQGSSDYFKRYDGRNGNTSLGDGERYKGRGLIQLTFKSNYELYGGLLGLNLVSQPELAAEPRNALLIACEFWKKLGLNTFADRDDIIDVTQRINGGQNGIEQRRVYLGKAKDVLASTVAKNIATNSQQPLSEPVLHRGDTVTQVVQLQRLLSAAGYLVTIDGNFGPGTETAVKQMQSDNGLSPDGVVGPRTWAELQKAQAPGGLV